MNEDNEWPSIITEENKEWKAKQDGKRMKEGGRMRAITICWSGAEDRARTKTRGPEPGPARSNIHQRGWPQLLLQEQTSRKREDGKKVKPEAWTDGISRLWGRRAGATDTNKQDEWENREAATAPVVHYLSFILLTSANNNVRLKRKSGFSPPIWHTFSCCTSTWVEAGAHWEVQLCDRGGAAVPCITVTPKRLSS